jgi:hypothetical protein
LIKSLATFSGKNNLMAPLEIREHLVAALTYLKIRPTPKPPTFHVHQ